MVPLIPGTPSLTPVICIWFLMFVFPLRTNFFLYVFSRCSSLKWALRCSMLYFLHLDKRFTLYISRWLFWIKLNDLILISWPVNYLILTSCCAEFGIFVCRWHLSFAASRTTVLLDYNANIIWNIHMPPMINELSYVCDRWSNCFLRIYPIFNWHIPH